MDGTPCKYCKKCTMLQPIELFYRTKNNKSYPDGRISWCKNCMKEYKKAKRVIDIKPIYKIENGCFIYEFD